MSANPTVIGVRVADEVDLFEELGAAPGTFQFISCVIPGKNPDSLPVNTLPDDCYHLGGLTWLCPGGCGAESTIVFRGRCDGHNRPSWEWNGSLDKPTLTPSILSLGCRWHGYLTDGVWKPCPDSACRPRA